MIRDQEPRPAATAAGEPAATERRRSARTCVGCGLEESSKARRRASARLQGEADGEHGPLVRLLVGPEGEVAVDTGSSSFGRGAYVHATSTCLAAAATRGLAKALRAAPKLGGAPVSAASLARAISDAFVQRFESLLATGKRSHRLELGSDAVTGACHKGRACLVIVATDAAQAAQLSEVRRAVAEGRGLAWGTKAQLGRVVRTGRVRSEAGPEAIPAADSADPGVGVVAVTDGRLARALRETALIVRSLEGASEARPVKPARGAANVEAGRASAGPSSARPPSGGGGGAARGEVSVAGRGREAAPAGGHAKGARSSNRASNGTGGAAKLRGSNDPGAETGSPDVVE